jgi:hypothetical protein
VVGGFSGCLYPFNNGANAVCVIHKLRRARLPVFKLRAAQIAAVKQCVFKIAAREYRAIPIRA